MWNLRICLFSIVDVKYENVCKITKWCVSACKTECLISLQGLKGSKGDMGMPGISGDKGSMGLPGLPVRQKPHLLLTARGWFFFIQTSKIWPRNRNRMQRNSPIDVMSKGVDKVIIFQNKLCLIGSSTILHSTMWGCCIKFKARGSKAVFRAAHHHMYSMTMPCDLRKPQKCHFLSCFLSVFMPFPRVLTVWREIREMLACLVHRAPLWVSTCVCVKPYIDCLQTHKV